ncbi:MAG: hypothetical protein AAF125_12135, partial [Chloroflexota bacterium]
LDERSSFGVQAPLDVYRLSTLNELFSNPDLTGYGDYSVQLDGFVEDVWGNRYEGGGTYTFTVAELLDLSPGILPGTPFEVGDMLYPGVGLQPGVAADVTVTVRFYPLAGGDVVEQTFGGTANNYGVFTPDEGFTFEAAGEYIVDYEARYTDTDGRLWAASLRGAGVVASPEGSLLAHGLRGLGTNRTDYRPAWFIAEQAGVPSDEASVNAPYHQGDVAWVADSLTSGIQPALSVQDEGGFYANWLRRTHGGYVAPDGTTLTELATQDALPVVTLGATESLSESIALSPQTGSNNAYSYLSYVTPAVTARQAVIGDTLPPSDLFWDMDDPLLGQIGAGATGMRPGDYAFLFGGAIVRNADAGVRSAGIYATMAVTVDTGDARGSRVYPPYRGAAGGPDGGPLFTLDGEDVEVFFHPTGTRPGDVLEVGDTLAVAGQVAPPLASDVEITVTSPSGTVTAVTTQASVIGYTFDPAALIAADEPGVWTVDVTVTHRGPSSAGESTSEPYPVGVTSYNVYVVPSDAERLPWNENDDFIAPAGFPRNFTFDVPIGWSDVGGYLTVTLPGAVVEDGINPVQGTAQRYQLNPTALNQRFPFYEGQDGRVEGPSSSDPVRLTFVFTGVNAAGEFDTRARQVIIRHDRLITID